jgi:hypothetical protein
LVVVSFVEFGRALVAVEWGWVHSTEAVSDDERRKKQPTDDADTHQTPVVI